MSDWREQAACVGQPTKWWFPTAIDPSAPGYKRRDSARVYTRRRVNQQTKYSQNAVAICAKCPVRLDCLAWAKATGEPDGIYGGLTPAERSDPIAEAVIEGDLPSLVLRLLKRLAA